MLWQADEPGRRFDHGSYLAKLEYSRRFFSGSWCPSSTPANFPCVIGSTNGLDHTAGARSMHPDGVGVAYADGSVRFIDENVSLNIWKKLVSIADGEICGCSLARSKKTYACRHLAITLSD